MKRSLCLFFLVLVILGVSLAFYLKSPKAEAGANLEGVVPFATYGGFTGFFDQKTGLVYLYDGSLKECVQISEIKALGSPMREIKRRGQDPAIQKFEKEKESP